MINYIFSGTGFAHGKHLISNSDIEKTLETGYLTGFNKERIEEGESYSKYKNSGGKLSAFEFMAEHKMGFRKRANVVPYPPNIKSYNKAENSLDLAVKAGNEAINNSGLSPDDIDMWMVSTATAHEMAPGTAATLKCYFVPFENKTPTHTLTSACVGFNLNLQLAIEKMNNNAEFKHIMLVHTEVMSELLCNEKDFVPLTSFGDAASAVILSKKESDKKEGVLSVINHEDLRMIDFLGADDKGNLYMNPGIIKSRAVPNMVNVINDLKKKENWKEKDIDCFIPHQTGHAIVKEVCKNAEIPENKCYQDIQLNYGNLSGASVPSSFHKLEKENKNPAGSKIITSVAGLGGEYGGFTYIVPKKTKFQSKHNYLKDKTVFITGATGDLAINIIDNLISLDVNLILHYRNEKKAVKLKEKIKGKSKKIKFLKADLKNESEVKDMIYKLKNEDINYFIHNAAATGSLSRASELTSEELKSVEKINHRSARMISEALYSNIKETILFVGSVAEDAYFSGSSPYVLSKKALHSYAVDLAKRMYKDGKKVVYYMPGIIDSGMAAKLTISQKKSSMLAINQLSLIQPHAIADRIVKSLYLPKITGVDSNYEEALMVRRDAYLKEDLS